MVTPAPVPGQSLSRRRSLEFSEGHKLDPSGIATAELGGRTRASSQWTADFDDGTWTAGLGANVRVRERVTLSASYTLSLSEVDLAYAGYGVTNFVTGVVRPDARPTARRERGRRRGSGRSS